MVTFIVIFLVSLFFFCRVIYIRFGKQPEVVFVILIFVSAMIGLGVTFGLGSLLPKIQSVETQPMVSVYADENQNEIYLKAVRGNQLVSRVYVEGIPREKIFYTEALSLSVVIEDVSPYMEIKKIVFVPKWASWFAFTDRKNEIVFHVPQTGVAVDINAFLK